MKLTNFKIVPFILTGLALLALSGCGGSTGTESDSALVGVPPIAVDDSAVGVSGDPANVVVIANDTDVENNIDAASVHITGTANAGDPLVVSGEGTWTVLTNGSVTFTPEAVYTDDPSVISYTVSDTGGLVSNEATVSIDYPQTAPVAVDDNTTAELATTVTQNVLENDSDLEDDIDVSTVKISNSVDEATEGENLEVIGEGNWTVDAEGNVTFTPEIGFTADPTPILYRVTDTTGLVSNEANISIDYPQAAPLNPDGNTTTLAGDGTAGFKDSTDGTGATAQFNFPRGITTDGTFLYLSESTGMRIRKIDPYTGETTTLAGNGVAAHQDSTDGTGATASFHQPRHLTYYNGFLYLAEYDGNTIRKISTLTGETTTLAGTTDSGYQDSTDGTGATARFDRPVGIANDGTYLYVSDAFNNYIRKVHIETGETSTLAGNGFAVDQESIDETGDTAGFKEPLAVTLVGDYLYVGNYSRIFRVNKTSGKTTFLAGDDTVGFQDSTDGTGATARFNIILGLYSDGTALYLGDAGNNRIRHVDLVTAETTTVAGDGTAGFQDSTDGTGATAQFNFPRGIVRLDDTLFIADGGNHRVRKIK